MDALPRGRGCSRFQVTGMIESLLGAQIRTRKKPLELPTKPKLWNPWVVCGTKPELQITTDESLFLRKTWLSPGDVFWVIFLFLFCFCDSLLANSVHMKQRVCDDRDIFSRFSSRIFLWDWVEKISFSFKWFSRCFGFGTFFSKILLYFTEVGTDRLNLIMIILTLEGNSLGYSAMLRCMISVRFSGFVTSYVRKWIPGFERSNYTAFSLFVLIGGEPHTLLDLGSEGYCGI